MEPWSPGVPELPAENRRHRAGSPISAGIKPNGPDRAGVAQRATSSPSEFLKFDRPLAAKPAPPWFFCCRPF